MKREIDSLELAKRDLLSSLNNTCFSLYEEKRIEALTRSDNASKRIEQMVKNAKRTIFLATSIGELDEILDKLITNESGSNRLEIRSIISSNGNCQGKKAIHESMYSQVSQLSAKANCNIELKIVEKTPFRLLIVDRKEAMWGETLIDPKSKFLWTNDPLHLGILKRAFESLWLEGESIVTDHASQSFLIERQGMMYGAGVSGDTHPLIV
jgi:hypothetical protein